MLRKSYSKTGAACRVTFDIPPEAGACVASLCGDFNDWDPKANPMKKKKDGGFWLTVSLEAGRPYRFRYLLDEERWENDWEADQYVPNAFCTEDSVVEV